MTLKWFTTPLIAAALILGGCEMEAPDEASPADTVEAAAPALGELMPINRSGVWGRAEAVRDGDELVVEAAAEGLEPDGEYAAFLHEGRCADGGPVRLSLGRITAADDGTGSLRFRAEPERAPAGPALFVQLHAADDQPVACADVGPGEGAS